MYLCCSPLALSRERAVRRLDREQLRLPPTERESLVCVFGLLGNNERSAKASRSFAPRTSTSPRLLRRGNPGPDHSAKLLPALPSRKINVDSSSRGTSTNPFASRGSGKQAKVRGEMEHTSTHCTYSTVMNWSFTFVAVFSNAGGPPWRASSLGILY